MAFRWTAVTTSCKVGRGSPQVVNLSKRMRLVCTWKPLKVPNKLVARNMDLKVKRMREEGAHQQATTEQAAMRRHATTDEVWQPRKGEGDRSCAALSSGHRAAAAENHRCHSTAWSARNGCPVAFVT